MKFPALACMRLAFACVGIVTLAAPANAQAASAQNVPAPHTQPVPQKSEGMVLGLAFSPDGRYLAAASSADNAIHVWSSKTGKEIAILFGHIGRINALAFTSDGAQLASAGVDGTARIWNIPSGAEAQRLRQQDGFLAVAVSPEGHTVATGGVDGFVRIWNLKDGTPLKAFKASDGIVSSLSYLPKTGKLLVSGGTDGKSAIWDPAAGTQVNVTSHDPPITSVAMSPDGARYLAGTAAGTTDIVDAKTAEIQGAFDDDMSFTTTTAIAPDLTYTLTGSSQDARVRLRMVQSSDRGQLIGHTQAIRSLVISPDSQLIFTGSEDGSVRLWSAKTQQQLCQIDIFADGSWTIVTPNKTFDASATEIRKSLGTYTPGLLTNVLSGVTSSQK